MRHSIARARLTLSDVSSQQTERIGSAGICIALPNFLFSNLRRITLSGSEEEIALQIILPGVQIVVATAKRIKLLVRAAFRNLSLFDNKDLVGATNGGKTMRDYKGRASLHQVRQTILDHHLRF